MLSRTADSLFWLARYVERAENIARIIQVGYRMASLARSMGSASNEWLSTVIASGCERDFFTKYGEANQLDAIDYLVRDPDNPSSIVNCVKIARENARSVRTALTTDMWDCLNGTWLGVNEAAAETVAVDRLPGFLEWVRERSQLFNGAYTGTMLRHGGYFFARLGTFVERADCTARILDVKYHILLPEHESVGGALDYYQWQTILRSVSAFRSYHWVYQRRLQPWLIAELLILRPEMPRSLVFCYEQINQQLGNLAESYGGKRGECHRIAGDMYAQLRYGRIQDIFNTGLHEFLTDFIDRSIVLGDEIAAFYLR